MISFRLLAISYEKTMLEKKSDRKIKLRKQPTMSTSLLHVSLQRSANCVKAGFVQKESNAGFVTKFAQEGFASTQETKT